MKSKVCTAREAVEKFVKPNDTVLISGFSQSTLARELLIATGECFKETGKPNNLTIWSGAGLIGGLIHVMNEGLEGLVAKNVCGHYGQHEEVRKFVADNKCLSYNFPQGIVSHLVRAAAGGENGVLTKIGLGTFVDPRLEGGKMNAVTTEDLVKVVNFEGEEYLYYPAPKADVCFLRGTVADEKGNVSLDEEMWLSWATYAARAAHVNGGKVIVQVKDVVKAGSLPARKIQIPGIMVDAIVLTQDKAKNHRFTPNTEFNRFLLGEYKMKINDPDSLPLAGKKVIGRRAAMEIKEGTVINIGIGTSEAVASVVTEEGCSDLMTMTVESGIIGGDLAPHERFGVHVNYDCLVDEPTQFDFYHAGGLDVTFLGNAETSFNGNVNVSKLGPLPVGGGGFIDIVQTTKKICFCGTMTAGGLKEEIKDGKLTILQEGRIKKFVNEVAQVSFNGPYAAENGFEILYITERAVFKLTKEGLMLTEYAPGIDLQKDVLDQMEFKPLISPDLKLMDEKLFRSELINLRADIEGK